MNTNYKEQEAIPVEPFIAEKTEEPEIRRRKVSEKMKYAFSSVTVEPVFFLKAIASTLIYQSYQDLLLLKACSVNLNYEEDICEALRLKNVTNETQIQNKEVHKYTARTVGWSSIVEQVLPIILVLCAGTYSDRFGRKLCIVVSLFGFTLQAMFLLLNTLIPSWSAEAAAVSFFLPLSLTGSFLVMNLSLYSYLADITTLGARTYRIGYATTAGRFGSFFISLLGIFIVFRLLNLGEIFTLATALYGACFVYSLIRIKETRKEIVNKQLFSQLFTGRLALQSMCSVIKKREGNARKHLLLALVVCFLQKGQVAGKW